MSGASMNGAPPRPLSIYLVAAEESGDALGAALVRALRAAAGGALTLAGVGGRAMAAEGVVSPFSIDELAIVGFSAIPARLPLILRRIRETADAVVAARPDALVIIDSPDFTHRVARRVRARARRRFRSSIMSRRRSGPGGPAGRAPCAPMSTACSRSCRSSRRRISASAGRLASMSAIR